MIIYKVTIKFFSALDWSMTKRHIIVMSKEDILPAIKEAAKYSTNTVSSDLNKIYEEAVIEEIDLNTTPFVVIDGDD